MSQSALYLIGVVALSTIGVGGLILIEWLRPGDFNTAIVGQIVTLIGPSIIGLMILLRSVANGEALKEVKKTAAITADKADRAAKNTEAVPSVTAEAVKDVLEKSLSRGSGT